MTEPITITTVQIYRDDAGEWRFTAYAANHEAIAVSSEGYERHDWAAKVAADLFPDAEIVERPSVPAA